MSLNYDMGQIENWQELKEQAPGAIQCMCFGSMFIGMPIISDGGKDDWREFALRLRAWEAVAGQLSSSGEPIPAETVKRFIGLRTNASRMTRAQFLKKLGETAMNDASRAISADFKELEAKQ